MAEKLKYAPSFAPSSAGICGRSRLAISEAEQGGRRWLSVYVRLGLHGDASKIGCPGQGTKRLLGLHRFRRSLAVALIQFQLGRSGNPDAWFAQAATCRARPHDDGAVHYRQDRDAEMDRKPTPPSGCNRRVEWPEPWCRCPLACCVSSRSKNALS